MYMDKKQVSLPVHEKKPALVTTHAKGCYPPRNGEDMSRQEVLFMEPKNKRTSEALKQY
jgi:hypothetical protein